MEELFYLSLVILLYLILPSLIGAVFLRAAAQYINRMKIPFVRASGTMVEALFLHFFILFQILAAMYSMGVDQSVALVRTLWYLPAGILINASIIRMRFNLTFIESLKITLAMFLMTAVLGGLIAGLVILFLRFTSP